MKRILVPIKSKLKPIEVEKELKNLNKYIKVPTVKLIMIQRTYPGNTSRRVVFEYLIIGTLILMEKSIVSYII
ncbi:hypothetical protein [Paraclostridium sordellii]|uniref:hypothetical protein n=1 Tax=Paraclostridium sordellii TaxID=1505 RepID=UPI00070AA8EC|nr:hypothetical protein [Paeniclostridium sordellii]